MKTITLLLLSTLAAFVPAAPAATLNIVASPIIGNSFDLTLQVQDPFLGHETARILWFGLDFDSVFAHVNSVTEGSLFFDLSPSSPAAIAGQAIAIDGIGQADVVGPLTLATLHVLFNGAPTAGTITISSNPDPNWGALQFDDFSVVNLSGSVNIDPNAGTVPEPSSLLLGGLGLVGLGLVGRRHRLRA